jgi:2-iminobutanoate/2-iminopropanoate deaminase
MLRKERVTTDRGPAAIGPYSQAIVAGDFVFVSGQIPLDPATGRLIEGDITAQTERVMKNLDGILEASGSSLDLAVKATIFMADLRDFEAMNKAYARAFTGDPPARATVQAGGLPKGALVEREMIALRESAETGRR